MGLETLKNPSEISSDVYFYHPLYFSPSMGGCFFFSSPSPADMEITAPCVCTAASLSVSVHLGARLESGPPAGPYVAVYRRFGSACATG